MLNTLYEIMNLPNSCFVGKRVYKKLFYDNALCGATDKKALQKDIDTIFWQYTLKPETIHIQSFQDQEREYLEVAILQVNLNQANRYRRLAEVIHRAIPYPLILVFGQITKESDDSTIQLSPLCSLSLASKRFSRAEHGAVVAEDFWNTGWIDLNNPSDLELSFLASLNITQLSVKNFYTFYQALIDRFLALDCAKRTGEFHLSSDSQHKQYRHQKISEIIHIEKMISDLRKTLQKETLFNRKIELNVQIKELEKKLQEKTEAIEGRRN